MLGNRVRVIDILWIFCCFAGLLGILLGKPYMHNMVFFLLAMILIVYADVIELKEKIVKW